VEIEGIPLSNWPLHELRRRHTLALVDHMRERTFYRDFWKPAQKASGLDIRPHECRHSYVTHLRAAGINDADLAEIAGHRVETMLARYTHALGESFSKVRRAID
jgi:integrase